MKKIGTVLPIGNEPEFQDIRIELKNRNVKWYERIIHKGGGTVFWFYELELEKLPSHPESQGSSRFPQYLPVDASSGHGIGLMDPFLEVHPGEDKEGA